jgi:hypothetical protein
VKASQLRSKALSIASTLVKLLIGVWLALNCLLILTAALRCP